MSGGGGGGPVAGTSGEGITVSWTGMRVVAGVCDDESFGIDVAAFNLLSCSTPF